MNIDPKSIKIVDLIEGYSNDADTGVRGYGGRIFVHHINVSSDMI